MYNIDGVMKDGRKKSEMLTFQPIFLNIILVGGLLDAEQQKARSQSILGQIAQKVSAKSQSLCSLCVDVCVPEKLFCSCKRRCYMYFGYHIGKQLAFSLMLANRYLGDPNVTKENCILLITVSKGLK